jgi:hypothetical protein
MTMTKLRLYLFVGAAALLGSMVFIAAVWAAYFFYLACGLE